MFKSVLLLGHIRGIRLEIHVSWLVILALLLVTMTTGLRQQFPEWSFTTAMTTALVTSLAFFLSIVLHELGHSLVAIRRGVPVRAITLFIFGGAAQMSRDTESAKDEFWIAIAGPLVSFALAALFLVLLAFLSGWYEPLTVALGWLGAINLIVAVFNLIPGFPLDGGRVFRAAVWHYTGDADKGMRAAVAGGRLVAYGLFAVAFWNLLVLGQLMGGIWLLLIGWFLLTMAEGHGRTYEMNKRLAGIKALDLAEGNVPRVNGHTTLDTWLNHQVLPWGQRAFMVEDNGGHLLGLVSLSDARPVPREQWLETTVAAVMTPLSEVVTVSPEESAETVLQMMNERSLNQLPVMANGQLSGWISRQQLLRTLENQLELRQLLRNR
ncbi:MAG: CBS domain-containing protein [Halomonadaceae bacterium]|nr:MAG: CBS domain-containing protein [Halomonadaceae bacterium]